MGKSPVTKRQRTFHRRHEPGLECSSFACLNVQHFRVATDRAWAICRLAEEAHKSIVEGADEVVGLPLSSVFDLIRCAAKGLVEEDLPNLDTVLFPRDDEKVAGPKAVTSSPA